MDVSQSTNNIMPTLNLNIIFCVSDLLLDFIVFNLVLQCILYNINILVSTHSTLTKFNGVCHKTHDPPQSAIRLMTHLSLPYD